MPAYLSHAVFADNMYFDLKKYNILKIDVSRNKLRLDSIKPDFFSRYSKVYGCNDENHNFFVQDFVKTQIEYIIDNKLYNDPNVMCQFYGHILHCVMDQYFHPYIYSKTDNIKANGLSISGKHFELESLIDTYLIKNYCASEISEKDYATFCVDPNFIFMSIEEKNIVNECYKKIYGYSNVSNVSMFLSIGLILEEKIVRCDSTSIKKKFYELLKLKYLSRNISFNESENKMNLERNTWFNPNNLEAFDDSVDDLFKKSLSKSLQVLELLNHNIYDIRKINDSFFKVFDDISLDTGTKCNYEKNIKK